MPKGRAEVAISTGHGSFHLGDRTEVVTNANTRLARYSRSRSAPPRDQTAPPRGRQPDRTRTSSPPGTAKLWCGQGGMGAERFGVVGTGCTRQQHSPPPREYLLVFKDID